MSYLRRQCAASTMSFLAMGMTLVTIGGGSLVWAVAPDIPRIQAEAEKGSVQQEIELGAAYLMGRGVERNEKQAAYWYEKAANSGDPEAQRQIGYFYTAGIGVERDPARAAYWFERAIAGGAMSAKVNLGVAYLWGMGVRKDVSLAAKLFQEAAAKGSGAGACYMGNLYYFGIGVTKDILEARRWYEMGSKLKDPRAKHNLALMLSHEQNPLNRERAAKLLRESAKAGFVPARHQLGLFLLHNPDIAKSPRESIDALEQAADEGIWKSSVVLGILARDGQGMSKDVSAAYYHFRVAELQGGDAATKMLANDMKALSGTLAQDQVDKMDAAADDWFKSHKVALEYLFENGEDRSEFPAFGLKSPDKDMHAGLLLTTPLDSGTGEAARSTP
jgi:TPR repeat protein